MKKNLAPPSFPTRNPKTLPKVVGRVYNPPPNLQFGGKGEETRLPIKGSRFRVTDRGK